MEHNLTCDLCGALDGEPIFSSPKSKSITDTYHLMRCRRCSLVYLDPRPTEHEMGRYYAVNDYYAYQRPNHTRSKSIQQLKRWAYQARSQHPAFSRSDNPLEQMARLVTGVTLGWRAKRRIPVRYQGRLLDVGCGSGEWLAWIRDNIRGWSVEGLEIDRQVAGKTSRSLNMAVHVGPLHAADLPSNFYNMISFWHSLEHTHSPSRELQEAFRLLAPGGYVGVEVPNIESFEAKTLRHHWYHLDIPRHLYHFTPSTLTKLLQKSGFQVVAVEPVRGHISWSSVVRNGIFRLLIMPTAMALIAAQTIGRLSPWAIRVYAIKV